MESKKDLKAEIITIEELLKQKDFKLPEYQRPYKWQERNVVELVQDILQHAPKAKYRLGTIVIHQHMEHTKTINHIVDGQQRFTSLKLIIFAFAELMGLTGKDPIKKYDTVIRQKIEALYKSLTAHDWKYNNSISIDNIRKNYLSLLRILRTWENEDILLLLQSSEVVVFYLVNITEAFQFFDSQNSRGKNLYPHDLLKAYHLREFETADESRKINIVDEWEALPAKDLRNLFANYLYRTKKWMHGHPTKEGFSIKDVHSFKGVTLNKISHYPYVRSLLVSHHFVDNYNRNYERQIDKQHHEFPFQLDQVMINGRRFFEYVDYYQSIRISIRKLSKKTKLSEFKIGDNNNHLINLMYENDRIHREGEQYIVNLFECVMLCFIDKFGWKDLNKFIEKAFIWSFFLRFEYIQLKFVSLDNYVLKHNLFRVIKDAIHADEVLNYTLKALPNPSEESWISLEKRMDKEVIKFYKDHGYYVQ